MLDVKTTLDNIAKSAYSLNTAFKNGKLNEKACNILWTFGPCIARAEKDLKEAETYISEN